MDFFSIRNPPTKYRQEQTVVLLHLGLGSARPSHTHPGNPTGQPASWGGDEPRNWYKEVFPLLGDWSPAAFLLLHPCPTPHDCKLCQLHHCRCLYYEVKKEDQRRKEVITQDKQSEGAKNEQSQR